MTGVISVGAVVSDELAQLGAVSSNEMHEARVNIDVEAFFIARNGLLLPRFSLGRHQHPAG